MFKKFVREIWTLFCQFLGSVLTVGLSGLVILVSSRLARRSTATPVEVSFNFPDFSVAPVPEGGESWGDFWSRWGSGLWNWLSTLFGGNWSFWAIFFVLCLLFALLRERMRRART